MSKMINAVFENGVFKPLEKVDIKEHERFQIIVKSKADKIHRKAGTLDGIIDIAVDCSDTDLSIHHDKYLYGETAV
jgi:predicted DNA-binding antitoxin AbrB/MazE fold protein